MGQVVSTAIGLLGGLPAVGQGLGGLGTGEG